MFINNMFKNWVIKYFIGGFLKTHHQRFSKKLAVHHMTNMPDAHCIECVSGVFKGQVIYKFPRNK